MPGVREASLNLGNNRLNLSWDTNRSKLSSLLAEIRRIGYIGHPYEPDRASAQIAAENRRHPRRLALAGLMFMQVMLPTRALWAGFNHDMTAEMAVTLRPAALLMTTAVGLYSR